MYKRLVIHCNAFSSCGAMSIIKQKDFQFNMNVNIFAFRGFSAINIKTHQNEQKKLLIIGAKCGILCNNIVVAT